MSLTTITDTLDTKLRNLRSGSESNDENAPLDFPKNRRHTLGQPLHLHSENIPYADESPERHINAAHALDALPAKPHLLSRSCTADAKAVIERNMLEKNHRPSLTAGALTYKSHKLQHSATAPINSVSASGLAISPIAASTPTVGPAIVGVPAVSAGSARNSYVGKNLRFSSSVYEHCCSEDDSEGSTTSDPKESALIIASPSFFLDRYNKKRRDHRLFRSASFNCRNYSTRHSHAPGHCGGGGGGGSSSGGTPTSGLTKDEKTDMNLTKKRQIQNKQNRSIKRRHTVGGPHDYAANGPPTNNPTQTVLVNNCNHQAHKTGSCLSRRPPLSSVNGNVPLSNNNNNNMNSSSHTQSSDNGNCSGGGGDVMGGSSSSSSGVSSGGNDGGNTTTSRATVAVAAPGGEHVLEVGIRIKNINRSRY